MPKSILLPTMDVGDPTLRAECKERQFAFTNGVHETLS